MKWKCALTSWTISWLRWQGMMWWVNLSYRKTFSKTWSLFCNIASKRVGQWCFTFYQPRSKPVLRQIRFQVARIQTSNGIKSLAAKQVCLGSVERVKCTNFDAKVELLSTFCKNFSQPTTTWFDTRHVWLVGGKTRIIAFQLVLEQCCRTSFTLMLPVFPDLKLHFSWRRHFQNTVDCRLTL